MAVEALLASQVSQACGLGDVAVVADHDVHVEIESAQPDESDHIVEADRRAAGLPPRDRGLGGVSTGREFLLRQACAATRFADEVSTVRTHEPNITDMLYIWIRIPCQPGACVYIVDHHTQRRCRVSGGHRLETWSPGSTVTGATAPPLAVRLVESMLASAPGPDITVGLDASLPAKIYKRHIRVDIAAKQAITRVHMVLHAD